MKRNDKEMTMTRGNSAVYFSSELYFHPPATYIYLTLNIYSHYSCATGYQHLFQCLSVHYANQCTPAVL